MTSAPDRREIVAFIDEAVVAGARQEEACEELGLSIRTLQRWKGPDIVTADARPEAEGPAPANRLSENGRERIVATCHDTTFASLPPSQIVPRLADRGCYIASESSFYRVMRDRGFNHRRVRARPTIRRVPPASFEAKGPCLVWSWDITWMPGPIAGVLFYLYLIVDIYSRKAVGWEVHESESAAHAARLLEKAVWAEGCLTCPVIPDADNGSPMKGATMKITMERLGVIPSFSRPRVSNDNPFSEALFRTCKYVPGWPSKGLASIDEARAWLKAFVTWCNTEHCHSSIRFVTTDACHRGKDRPQLARRDQVYKSARQRHSSRWSASMRNWRPIGSVWLNPDRNENLSEGHGGDAALPHRAGGGGPMASDTEHAA